MDLQTLNTDRPDRRRPHATQHRPHAHLDALGVRFRPHVKTTKCTPSSMPRSRPARTSRCRRSKEAEQFFAHGIRDIVYAVGMVPAKLKALALRRQGCDLKLVADSPPAAHAIAEFRARPALRRVDRGRRRRPPLGIPPDADLLIDVGRALVDGGMVLGGARAREPATNTTRPTRWRRSPSRNAAAPCGRRSASGPPGCPARS